MFGSWANPYISDHLTNFPRRERENLCHARLDDRSQHITRYLLVGASTGDRKLDHVRGINQRRQRGANVETHKRNDHYTLVEGDVRDADLVRHTLAAGRFDQGIHLAAMP